MLVGNGMPFNNNRTNARVYRITAAANKDANLGDAQRGVVDVTNDVALTVTGNLDDAPSGLLVSLTQVLLGMTARRVNGQTCDMLTLTLQAGALFSNGFD